MRQGGNGDLNVTDSINPLLFENVTTRTRKQRYTNLYIPDDDIMTIGVEEFFALWVSAKHNGHTSCSAGQCGKQGN